MLLCIKYLLEVLDSSFIHILFIVIPLHRVWDEANWSIQSTSDRLMLLLGSPLPTKASFRTQDIPKYIGIRG